MTVLYRGRITFLAFIFNSAGSKAAADGSHYWHLFFHLGSMWVTIVKFCG